MDSDFGSFRQTPRGRGFILLGFYTLFKCFIMFWLVLGLESSFDRFQNLGPNYWKFLGHFWSVRGCLGLIWVFV